MPLVDPVQGLVHGIGGHQNAQAVTAYGALDGSAP